MTVGGGAAVVGVVAGGGAIVVLVVVLVAATGLSIWKNAIEIPFMIDWKYDGMSTAGTALRTWHGDRDCSESSSVSLLVNGTVFDPEGAAPAGSRRIGVQATEEMVPSAP